MAEEKTDSIKSYDISDWSVHNIAPEYKDGKWAWNIFMSNRNNLKPAFGGWYSNRYDAELIRQFAYGNQPEERYKINFDPQDKEAVYTGLNWNIAPVIPVLRNRVLTEMASVPSEIECEAIDELANSQRNKDKLRLKAQPILDEKLRELSKKIGYDRPIKSGFDQKVLKMPMNDIEGLKGFTMDLENDDELNIYMDGYYNQDVELANELSVNALFKYNDFDELRKLLHEDAFDFGTVTFRAYVDTFSGLPKFQYMHPFKVYVQQSKFKDYKDMQMWYYKVPATLSEVLEYIGDELTDTDVKYIWENAVKRKDDNWRTYQWYSWDWRRWSYADQRKYEIDMYYFELKTSNAKTYEVSENRNGKLKLKNKPFDYEPKSGKSKVNYWANCVYGGYFVEGLETIYKWSKLPNMPRYDGKEQDTSFSINIYKFSEKGLTEMMIPFADDYQLNFLKRQHAIIKSLPKGYSFNWDALAEITYGDGGRLTKMDLIQMYRQTGSTIHKSLDEEGNPIMANANAPHMELINGLDPNIMRYTEMMYANKSEMADVIGLSPTADSVNPNPKMLVGVQQAAQQASSSARQYLYSGIEEVVSKTGEYLSCQIQYILSYNKETAAKLKSMVGRMNMAVIESMENIPLHKFAIFAKTGHSPQERQMVEQLILDAYSKGKIGLDDVFVILMTKNIKQAIRIYNLREKKAMLMNMQAQQAQSDAANRSNQEMAQLKILLEQMRGDTAKAVADISGKFDIMQEQVKQKGDYEKKLLQETNKAALKEKELANAV